MLNLNPGQMKKLVAMVSDWSLSQLVDLTSFVMSGASWAEIMSYCKTIG